MRNTPGLLIYRRWRRALVHLILYLPQVRLAKAYVQEMRTNLWRRSVKASQRVHRRGGDRHGAIFPRRCIRDTRPCAASQGQGRHFRRKCTNNYYYRCFICVCVYVCMFQARVWLAIPTRKRKQKPPFPACNHARAERQDQGKRCHVAADARHAIMHFYVSARSAGIVIGVHLFRTRAWLGFFGEDCSLH